MTAPASVVFIESSRMSERKQTVIEILRSEADFVSGEAISAALGISRNAVHKHIQSLRQRGYEIVGVSRRGYKLQHEPSRLCMEHITALTAGSRFGRFFRYHDEIESTNLEAKALANSGAPEGVVVVAEAQSAGRGRRGRSWTSPPGKGLLFSALLRPAIPMVDAHLLTLVAATALAETMERFAEVPVQIKWPNDLFIDNRKLGGILMEVAGEHDEVEWVIAGMGVNVNTEYSELPVPLRRTATSLKITTGQSVDRSDLLAALLLSFDAHYTHAVHHGFERAITNFRSRDFLLHRTVDVETREGIVRGTAVGIDEYGALLVESAPRRIQRLHSGEVTLHL